MKSIIFDLYRKYCQPINYLNKDVLERIGEFSSPNTKKQMALATKEYKYIDTSYARQNAKYLLQFLQNLDQYIKIVHPLFSRSSKKEFSDVFTWFYKSKELDIYYVYTIRIYTDNRVILVKSRTHYKNPRETYILNYKNIDDSINFNGTRLSEILQSGKQDLQDFLTNIQGMNFGPPSPEAMRNVNVYKPISSENLLFNWYNHIFT